jgi:hypothetical protein
LNFFLAKFFKKFAPFLHRKRKFLSQNKILRASDPQKCWLQNVPPRLGMVFSDKQLFRVTIGLNILPRLDDHGYKDILLFPMDDNSIARVFGGEI